MELPSINELGEKIAEKALDGYVYNGRTLRDWISVIAHRGDQLQNKGTYQCFHCCTQSVIWDSDFDFSDMGYEGEGIVHMCHCTNCGAEIEYKIAIPDEDEENGDQGD